MKAEFFKPIIFDAIQKYSGYDLRDAKNSIGRDSAITGARWVYIHLALNYMPSRTRMALGRDLNKNHATITHHINGVNPNPLWVKLYNKCKAYADAFIEGNEDIFLVEAKKNRQLIDEIIQLKRVNANLLSNQSKIDSIYNKLDDRGKKNLIFKAETILKIQQREAVTRNS